MTMPHSKIEMDLDTDFASSLLHNLNLEHPPLPPTTWESIPSESGHFHLPSPNPPSLPHASSVSESSLVRLAMNALQGLEWSLISVQKLSAAFRSDAADRTFHQVPSLWSRSSSTHALGNILHSIGCSGLLVFLIGKFVDHFTDLNVESEKKARESAPYSLVNQAFAVAVGKVVEGYMCGLDTLYGSVGLRRSAPHSAVVGCINSVVHCEVSLLEVYLHTKELRTRIESLAYICNLYRFCDCFQASSFDELIVEAKAEFCSFYRGGDLLTYLYTQLQVADPAHRPVLKFLFLHACEPYFGFIRSWIFKAEISDPYEEFVVEYVHSHDPYVEPGISVDFPLAATRERDGVPVPCFLKDILIPLFRAGQQLQVLAKLLQLCTYVVPKNHTYESILPCWSGFTSSCPSYASPLTFSKGNIEAMVLARECYYKRMQDGLQILLAKLEFKFQQVVPQDALVLLDYSGMSPTIPVLVPLDKNSIERKSDVVADDLDSDELSTRDYSADEYESSEYSSSTMSEEHDMLKQTTEFPSHIVGEEQKYFSSLSFSYGVPVDTVKKLQCSDSCLVDKISSCEREDAFGNSHHKGILTSQILDAQFSDSISDKDWPDYFEKQSVTDTEYKEGLKSRRTDFASKVNERIMGALKEGSSDFRKRILDNNVLIEEAFGKIESQRASYTDDTFALRQLKVNYHNNFLSMNPMLTKNNFLHLTSRCEERCKTDLGDSLAYFDFSHIKDPCKVFPVKVPVGLMDSVSTTGVRCDHHVNECSSRDDALTGRTIVSDFLPSSDLRDHGERDATLTNVSGGSCWESLLGRFGDTVINRLEDHRESSAASFDIPLGFIIDKCLLQEIMLQYKYVSKLAINLLEEGFDLQEHLLALRRYHFMELADWADLFIMSLWHHKWSITKADHRLSEIQSFLESSVQRSSCERDHKKDRLYVYLKGHDAMPLSASVIGVHSFNFLGLGYRVDWPISIVLTPGSLKIYAEIFSFLIQVKLALFSLTDIWRQLKMQDLVHLICWNNHSEEHVKEVSHFNAVVKMRHQVNHFVSTLQQYVESQLSHVSWCRFLYSLKHKVKDMMDLQCAHMAYLSDSLHICFLSDETKPIACIIESILQCALDFRSCLTGGVRNAGAGQGNLIATINISQVIAIKRNFDKNIKELHSCYLKSPKHGEFGLSHFWEYLNYNQYYSDAASVSTTL